MTVEKLLGLDVPKRVQYLRVIVMELARITDHLVCNAVIGVDTGALTGFVYLFQQRELVYEIYEEICGARLTTNLGRIGGFERDFTPKAWNKINKFLAEFPVVLKEFENLLKRNRIRSGNNHRIRSGNNHHVGTTLITTTLSSVNIIIIGQQHYRRKSL